MIDHEYSYTKTLHLIFDEHVGIGHYGFTEKELAGFVPNLSKTLQEYVAIVNRIDIIIDSVLKTNDVKVNWINTHKVDISNIPMQVDSTERLLALLEMYLKSVFPKNK